MIDEKLTNKKSVGRSGTSIASGIYTEEYLSTLQGFEAADLYDKMKRSDPKVRGIFFGINNPIKRAVWDIEPASDDKLDLESAALIKHILFTDINWTQKLHEILTFILQGYSAFEVIHANKENKELGQYTGLAQLGFRRQSSIIKWLHNETTGELERVQQRQVGDIPIDVEIETKNMLFFFNEKEGDNNGFPIARPMYGPYRRKLLEEELKIIGIERFAIPTPTLKTPANIKPTDEQYTTAQNMLAAYTSAENSYIMYPEGWELKLESNGNFNPEKIQKTIKAEDEQMSASVVATFLELGVGGNGGAYALGTDLSDMFLNGIEHFATLATEPINNQLIPNLIFHNYGDTIGVMPKLVFSGISDKAGKELQEIVTGYTSAGVIVKDEQLEDYVRKVHKLPKKAEGEMLENQEAADDTETPPVDSDIDEDIPTEEEKTQLSIKLQENAKTARGLITESSIKTRELMQEKLTFTGDKLVADVMRSYKQLPEGQKIKATDNVKPGGQAKFKRELKGVLTGVAVKAIDQAAKEAPVPGVKLKDLNDHDVFKLLTDKELKQLQNEFSKLPTHVRALLIRQIDQTVVKQTKDLTDAVIFQFQSSLTSTADPNLIEQDMKKAAKTYTEGGTVQRGAANISAFTVNNSRNAYFFDDEVSQSIASMTFVNPDPKAEICRTLQNQTFLQSDAEFMRYNPPLHHNCKSYLRANLKTSTNQPEVNETLPSISETAQKSITLSEHVDAK